MQLQGVLEVPFIPARRALTDLKLYLFAAAFIAGNLLLPAALHGIPQGGQMLLPLFFFTLIAAYSEGLAAGVLVAVASPLINHALTGMPGSTMLPVVLFKSLLLAASAAFAAERLKKISLAAIAAIVITMQIFGGIFQFAVLGDLPATLHTVRLGLPGLLVMILGGYALLRLIAKGRERGRAAR